ncbi:hypothetical protein R3I94_013150 [Phoxinus phoxinus]
MADKCDLCLLGLILLSSLLTGTSGVQVFISSGESVSLSCYNDHPDCRSTTWTYDSFRDSETVYLITGGMKNKDTERHERLSLESDCSLNITTVTGEDYGLYRCEQSVNGEQGPVAFVSLHVLHVSVSSSSSSSSSSPSSPSSSSSSSSSPSSSSSSSSSSQTEISPGRSLTLSCQLYTRFPCDWFSYEGLELLWVSQTGVDLKTDSRYQISSSSSYHCILTLTTTLLNEDDHREWRCEVTDGDQVQTSVRYTVKYSDPGETEVSVNAGLLYRVIVTIVEMAVFAAPTVILLQIICARRAGRKDSQHPEEIEMPTILQ